MALLETRSTYHQVQVHNKQTAKSLEPWARPMFRLGWRGGRWVFRLAFRRGNNRSRAQEERLNMEALTGYSAHAHAPRTVGKQGTARKGLLCGIGPAICALIRARWFL